MLATLPPDQVAVLFVLLLVAAPLIFLFGSCSPTDTAREARRRKYANRRLREGKTYTPRPHLHVTGTVRGYHQLGLAPDPRVRADGKPYRR